MANYGLLCNLKTPNGQRYFSESQNSWKMTSFLVPIFPPRLTYHLFSVKKKHFRSCLWLWAAKESSRLTTTVPSSSRARSCVARLLLCRVAVEKLAPESSALSELLSAAVTTSVDKCKQKWDDGRKVETLEFHPIDTCSSFGGASIGPSDRVTRCPIQSRLQQKWNAAEPWWETPESE